MTIVTKMEVLDMLIAFVIWSFVALLLFGIGIVGYKSKEVVGFFTFAKPPIVKDVQKYNHAVGLLWVVAAIILEIIGIPCLFIKQNSPIAILLVFGVMIWVIGLIVVYLKIEAKHKR